MHLKMPSAKWRPSSLGLNVLNWTQVLAVIFRIKAAIKIMSKWTPFQQHYLNSLSQLNIYSTYNMFSSVKRLKSYCSKCIRMCSFRGLFKVFMVPVYSYALRLIPSLISNHMLSEVWDKIAYPFPNFNRVTLEVWEWISDFIPHLIKDVITYSCWININPC